MTKDRIFILGFMGSGKTTIARKLARQLNYNAIDLDLQIEIHLNRKISDIFFESGESYFRQQEKVQLRTTKNLSGSIVSVGGGTPCSNGNMEWMLQNGLCIYIEMPTKALVSRLSKSKMNRPLIKGMDDHQMEVYIQDKMDERKAFYELAHLKVSGLSLSIPKLAKTIELFSF